MPAGGPVGRRWRHVPGLGLAVSLLSDEQLAGIARWWGLADSEYLAELFPELAEEAS